MAASTLHETLNAVESVNGIMVDPTHVQINESHRARHFALKPDHIRTLAASMAEQGQLQAVSCRTVADGHLELIFGEHRHAAAKLINEDDELRKIAEANGHINADTGLFMLRTNIVKEDNDVDALVKAILENRERSATSPIDDAYNQQKLRDYGWEDDAIAKFYGVQKAWIKRMQKLLELTDEEKKLVHEGQIPVLEAQEMVSLDPKVRAKVIKQAKKDDGTIDKAKLKEGRAEAKTAEGKTVSRTMAQVRKDIEALIDDDKTDPALVDFLTKGLMKYLKGKGTFKVVQNALAKYVEAVNNPPEPAPADDEDSTTDDAETVAASAGDDEDWTDADNA